MVIVSRKFNDMPVGKEVMDVDFLEVFTVVSGPRTGSFGTMIRLQDRENGRQFHDDPQYYRPVV